MQYSMYSKKIKTGEMVGWREGKKGRDGGSERGKEREKC